MADFQMNVNYAKPQVTSLGDMVNMASGIQNFQQTQQMNPLALQKAQLEVERARQLNPLELEKAQIENQVLKQKNDERLKLQEFTSNPTNWQTNGRIDMDKINAVIPKIAPLTGSDVISSLSGLHKSQTEAASAKQALTQTERTIIGNTDHSLGLMGVNDPKQIIKVYEGLIKNNPDNTSLERMINARIDLLKQAQAGPNITKDLMAESASLLSIPQQRQEFAPKVGLTNTGSQLKETITTPMSPTGQAPNIQMTGRSEPLTIAPGSQYVATGRVDQNNNPTALQYDQSGRLLGEVTIPAGVAPNMMQGAQQPGVMPPQGAMPQQGGGMPQPQVNAPQAPAMPSNAPVRMRPGENADTLRDAQAIRTRSMAAAANVPNQQFNSNQIIKIADDVISGKGAGAIANLTGGYAALPFGGDNATNLQQLGHYMALQTAELSKSSGLSGTDAANQIAGQIAGTTDWTAPAIKQTARVNRALSTATSLFNQGVENEFNKTKDPFAARDFQNKWSQIADVNAIRLYDAMRNNDKDGMKEVVNAVGGPDSIGYKNLLTKIKFMSTLVKGQ
jgi:YD repeat-containing protein